MKTTLLPTREARGAWQNPFFRLALLLFGVLLIVALLADLRGAMRRRQAELARLTALERPEALALGVADERYEDPAGRFALTLPAPWVRLSGEQADPYTAIFRGPRNIEISVVVSELPHDRFDLLLAQIRGRDEQLEIRTNLRTVEFLGLPAAERQSRLPRSSVYALDFMVGRTAHHILVSIPHEEYARLLPMVREFLQTYEAPAGRRWSPSSTAEHDAHGPADADSDSN